MSGEPGRWPSEEQVEQRFGHIVLQTDLGEVYSLDLYQASDEDPLNCTFSGYYLPPTSVVSERVLRRWERVGYREIPRTIPLGVHFSADADLFNQIGDIFRGNIPANRESSPSRSFRLYGPGGDFHEMYSEVSPPSRYPGRSVWSGTIGGKGSKAGGEFTFVLEQYGTIEPVLLLLVVIFFFVFIQRDTSQEAAECYRQAVHHCGGERNVKSVNVTRRIIGATFSVETGCQFECEHPPDGGGG